MKTEQKWFYQKNHQQHGPLDTKSMLDLLRRKVISSATQVWTSDFGAEWKPLSDTDLMTMANAPSSSYASKWKIAALTLLGASGLIAALYIAIPQQAPKEEEPAPPTQAQQQAAPLHSMPNETTSTPTQYGCNTAQIQTEVMNLFNSLPMNRLVEKKSIAIKNIDEHSKQGTIIECAAHIEASDATESEITYTITPLPASPANQNSNRYTITLHVLKTVPLPHAHAQKAELTKTNPNEETPSSSQEDKDGDMDSMYAGLGLKETEHKLLRPGDIEYLGDHGHYIVVIRPLGHGKYKGHISVDYDNGGGDVTGMATINRHSITIIAPADMSDPNFPTSECKIVFQKRKNGLVFKSISKNDCLAWHGASVGFQTNSLLIHKHHS